MVAADEGLAFPNWPMVAAKVVFLPNEREKLNDNQVIIRFSMFTLITIMIVIFFGHVIDWVF